MPAVKTGQQKCKEKRNSWRGVQQQISNVAEYEKNFLKRPILSKICRVHPVGTSLHPVDSSWSSVSQQSEKHRWKLKKSDISEKNTPLLRLTRRIRWGKKTVILSKPWFSGICRRMKLLVKLSVEARDGAGSRGAHLSPGSSLICKSEGTQILYLTPDMLPSRWKTALINWLHCGMKLVLFYMMWSTQFNTKSRLLLEFSRWY